MLVTYGLKESYLHRLQGELAIHTNWTVLDTACHWEHTHYSLKKPFVGGGTNVGMITPPPPQVCSMPLGSSTISAIPKGRWSMTSKGGCWPSDSDGSLRQPVSFRWRGSELPEACLPHDTLALTCCVVGVTAINFSHDVDYGRWCRGNVDYERWW